MRYPQDPDVPGKTWPFTIASNPAPRLAREELPSQMDSLTENDGLPGDLWIALEARR